MRQTDRPAAGAAAAATDGAAVVAAVDAALEQLRGAVDTLAAIDVATVPADCVTRAVRGLAAVDGRIDGLQARFVRAAEEADVPRQAGATSTSDWLSAATGRSKREAARTGRMARSMDTTPELAERLARGDVGPDQADRVARGLHAGTLEPADARDLLDHARHLPPGSFDREAKRLEGRRHQQRLRDQERAAHDARSARRWRRPDGSLKVDLTVSPVDGDVVDKALDAFVRPDPAEVPDHLRRTYRQVLADAFVDMCRTVLQTGAAGELGEVGGVRPQVMLVVGPELLASPEEAARAGATAVSDLDTVLSAEGAQQVLCDAVFRRVVVDATGQALDVGRATRKWSGAIRAAITALDGGDRTPGSDLPPARCEIHHIEWWRNGGATSVANGVLLGKRGHDMIHVEGWTLEMDPVTRVCRWTSPDGATTQVTYPRGAAARGEGAPHDIPELRAPAAPRHGAGTAGPGAGASPAGTGPPTRGADPPRPGTGPPTRGPAAPRAGTDPPRTGAGPPRRGADPPAEVAGSSLQLDL